MQRSALGLYRVSAFYILLKPTGHVTHRQFNIQQLYVLPLHCIYVFCVYLRTNSDLCHLQHKLIGFYNRDEKCLQRGTDGALNRAVCATSVNISFKQSGAQTKLKCQPI